MRKDFLFFVFFTVWTAGAFSDGEEGLDDEDEYTKKSEGQGISQLSIVLNLPMIKNHFPLV